MSNVATEPGETDSYTAADHYRVLRQHLGGDDIVDVVLANSDPAE